MLDNLSYFSFSLSLDNINSTFCKLSAVRLLVKLIGLTIILSEKGRKNLRMKEHHNFPQYQSNMKTKLIQIPDLSHKCQNTSNLPKSSTIPNSTSQQVHNSKVETFSFIHQQVKNNMLQLKDKILRTIIRKIQLKGWYSNAMIGQNKKVSMISLMVKKEFTESERISISTNKRTDLNVFNTRLKCCEMIPSTSPLFCIIFLDQFITPCTYLQFLLQGSILLALNLKSNFRNWTNKLQRKKMLDKGYMKNFNKLKSKLNLDNSRPSFLEDDQSDLYSKFTKPLNQINRPYTQTKNSKAFDLDQIKKQLGLIESRNSKSSHTVNFNKNSIEPVQFSVQSSSFKKQKSQQPNAISRLLENKKQTPPLNTRFPQIIQQEKTGFTQRITEIVKMRQQHEKIINSLVNKKTSNISTDEESFVGFKKRNPEIQNKYIRVLESYQISKREKKNEPQLVPERLSFKKQTLKSRQDQQIEQQPHKKRTVQEMYNDIQEKLNTPKKKQSPKQKVYKTQSSSANDESVQNISQSQFDKSLSNQEMSVSKRQDTFRKVLKMPEIMLQGQSEVDLDGQMNESTFQIQQYVNLIASLSQFQFRGSTQESQSNLPLESQLHFSIESFVNESMSKSKLGNKNQLMSSVKYVELKYVFMETAYKNNASLLKTVKKIKNLNGDFVKIVEFLCLNEVWEGLFSSESIQYENSHKSSANSTGISTLMEYRGLQFDSGNYSQVLLSNKPLQDSQKKMLIFNFDTITKTLICDISLILLSRLINLNANKYFPQMLNRIFGYQFKTFKIDNLNDFMEGLEYIDRLREIHNKQLKNQGGLIVQDKLDQSLRQKYSLKHISYPEQSQHQQSPEDPEFLHDTEKHCDFFLYGQQKTTECYEIIRPCFFSEKNKTQTPIRLYEFRELMRHQKYMKKLSETYQVLAIINNKELPVKSIKLKHFENHFVVVSVNVVEEGLYFMSVGGQYDGRDQSVEQKYRICLISTSTKTILECVILSRNESYPVYLPKQQFEFYVSAYQSFQSFTPQGSKSSQNFNHTEVINFTFYIQSSHISAKNDFGQMKMMENKQLEFQLRLKEEYKNYTSMVLEQFIELSFLDKQITKFFIQLDFDPVDSQNTDEQLQTSQSNKAPTIQQTRIKTFQQNQIQDPEFTFTIKSLKFPDIQNAAQMQNSCIKPTSISQINPNLGHKKNSSIFSTLKHQVNEKLIQTQNETIFTFDQIFFEEHSYQLTILRVHLKALDLFIDCINTANLKDLSISNHNDFEFKIKYNQERVLCDLNHHKNTVLLRSNTINLIYLTKDSPIQYITNQNEFCQKNNTNQVITHKIYRKEW